MQLHDRVDAVKVLRRCLNPMMVYAMKVVRPGAEQDKWIAQLWLREGRYTPTVPVENRHADAESVVAEFDKAWRES